MFTTSIIEIDSVWFSVTTQTFGSVSSAYTTNIISCRPWSINNHPSKLFQLNEYQYVHLSVSFSLLISFHRRIVVLRIQGTQENCTVYDTQTVFRFGTVDSTKSCRTLALRTDTLTSISALRIALSWRGACRRIGINRSPYTLIRSGINTRPNCTIRQKNKQSNNSDSILMLKETNSLFCERKTVIQYCCCYNTIHIVDCWYMRYTLEMYMYYKDMLMWFDCQDKWIAQHSDI